jgi:hypothetical protein
VQERVLNDTRFQILTDEDILSVCVLRYEFRAPVEVLIYLSSKILAKPGYQIIYSIAHEIAKYILSVVKTFEKEVEAVRNGRVITESEAYKMG